MRIYLANKTIKGATYGMKNCIIAYALREKLGCEVEMSLDSFRAKDREGVWTTYPTTETMKYIICEYDAGRKLIGLNRRFTVPVALLNRLWL